MKLKEYKKIIKQTAIMPEGIELAYCMLGLVGEFNEFVDKLNDLTATRKDKIKECGDVWWYLTAFCELNGIDIEKSIINIDLINPLTTPRQDSEAIRAINSTIGILSERVKKYYRDGTKLEKDLFRFSIPTLTYWLTQLGNNYNLLLSEVFKTNHDKLLARRATNTLHGSGDNREEING